ncbi:MAG: hypothetical protein OXH86_01395 [Acidimicrobiaceae bacterium]|nr:hypothetical protein [Acidimicrobiaceae bacterium]
MTADRVQVAFYVAALVIAVVRLVIIWTIGWRSYSGKGTVVVRLTPRGRELDAERIEFAVSCPTHGNAYRSATMPEAMSYLALTHLAVTPDKAGTRNWTYRVVTGERIGWVRWTWRCLRLATVRRFREPDIGTCPAC